MQTVADIGEAGLLQRLQRSGRRRSTNDAGVLLGIGDDAALLTQLGPTAVLSTDMLIEGIDFERRWASPVDIGHKAAAVNLSDLAAMGAAPRGLLASLALRPSEKVVDVLALLRTIDRVGRHYGAPLVGGDLSKIDGPLVLSVTAVGRAPTGRVLRRHGGRPGDAVLVSGCLGGAAGGLVLLQGNRLSGAGLRRRQLRPTPQVELGQRLAAWGKVRACADISDGLARDALHLAAPGCGVRLDVRLLPLARGLKRLPGRRSPAQLALYGGEDFELVMAVAAKHVAAVQDEAAEVGQRLTVVGEVIGRRGLHWAHGAIPGAAWDHFAEPAF